MWSSEQIMALAPDTASAKAGKTLAAPRKWATLGCDEGAVWGECQGSAKEPYQAQIDLTGPAFKCSCPSRKFPCKHTLGLFLLHESQPTVFSGKERPAWVEKWFNTRTQTAEQRAKKQERAGEVGDKAAQSKRANERVAKVAAGLSDLELWLEDAVREGLATLPSKPFSVWETQAARLTDAQARSLGNTVRNLASVVQGSAQGWQTQVLEQFGRLHLLIEGFAHLENLPTETQADIRTTIGWNTTEDELVGTAKTSVRDRWLVLGQRVDENELLREQRFWLWGEATGRAALLLFFIMKNRPLEAGVVVGTSFEADLVYYPSGYTVRAAIKQRHGTPQTITNVQGYPTIDVALSEYAHAIATNPWLECFPMLLAGVVPFENQGKWYIRDSAGQILPVRPDFACGWQMLALSGGHPVVIFGEWENDVLLPLGIWADGRWVSLKGD